MGYRQNQGPFLHLAQRALYDALREAALGLHGTKERERAAAVESWLLALSGLAPRGQRGFALPRGVRFRPPMAGTEWHCFRVRPANHPRRRIAGAARLLARFLEPGLLKGLRTVAAVAPPRALTRALSVASDTSQGPAYIGEDRARDLAVNVALPLFHSMASSQGQPDEAEGCLKLYRQFGKLQGNDLTREMTEQLLPAGWAGVVDSARRQQGLVYLHHLLTGAS